MAEWKRPDNIDKHPLRYSKLVSDIERVITRRHFQGLIDGYVLEMAIELAEIAQPRMVIKRGGEEGYRG